MVPRIVRAEWVATRQQWVSVSESVTKKAGYMCLTNKDMRGLGNNGIDGQCRTIPTIEFLLYSTLCL
jgi:hypothetical protein